jgi:hypothetical protein
MAAGGGSPRPEADCLPDASSAAPRRSGGMRIHAALALACALTLLPASGALADGPALFKVGAATESIDPLPGVPVYAGGFGASPPITKSFDPMEVRAFYVAGGDGKHAVAMATVDSQAYFAAYQEGPYGISDVRAAAAQEISAIPGAPKMTASDIIVQGTHSHAGATLEGIWGPVPLPYLKHVHDQAIAAIVAAARDAVDAHLQFGAYDAPWIDNMDNNQTDSYPGWTQDGQVSILRAVTPGGAPVATFASIPAHPDIVEGSEIAQLDPDYFGVVRRSLDARLGGVNVVGPATLGREETPVQVGDDKIRDGQLQVSQWFGGVVTSILGQALGRAHWITDPTVASANTFTQVAGTNPLLLALVAANKLPDDQKQQMFDNTGEYPIDRSTDPPYLTGSVIGTDLTALRIGKEAFLSMPGEPFPEIRYALAGATQGADHIVALSKGQDDWGYFYPAWTWGFTSFYNSDHNIYNIAPQAGDQVINDQSTNLKTLGFSVSPAVGKPLPTKWEQAISPGVQGMANPTWGDAGSDGRLTVDLRAIYDGAFIYEGHSAQVADTPGIPVSHTPVHVDFGDGTSADVAGDKRTPFTHSYAPGTYTLHMSATDGNGQSYDYKFDVTVFPALHPSITSDGTTYTAHVEGGDGHVLDYQWSYADGSKASGPTAPASGPVTLRVVDGTTAVATATAG